MTIKLNTAKHFLQNDGVQISTEAAAYLALYLDQVGETIARDALEALKSENANRQHLGIPPRRRLTAHDLKKVLNGE